MVNVVLVPFFCYLVCCFVVLNWFACAWLFRVSWFALEFVGLTGVVVSVYGGFCFALGRFV